MRLFLLLCVWLLALSASGANGYLTVSNGTTYLGGSANFIVRSNGTTLVIASGAADGYLTVTNGNTVLGAAPAGGGTSPFADLTHYWSLDEASGTRDDSVGVLDMTGAGVSGVAAKDGNGASFDSGETLASASSDFGAPYSFSLWVQYSSFTGSPQFLYKNTTDFPDTLYIIAGPNAAFNAGEESSVTVSGFTSGSFHLLVGTVSAAYECRISIDGGTFTALGSPSAGGGAGSFNLGDIQSLISGLIIDEVGIYNVVVSQDNVTYLWNGSTGNFYRP